MPLRFTEASVAKLVCPPGSKDALFFSSALAGFGVRVTQAGTKGFLAQYTNIAGIRRRVPIGEFGKITVKQAEADAMAILANAARGRDPYAERKTKAVTMRSEAVASKARKAEEAFLFRTLVDVWERDRTKIGRARPTWSPLRQRCTGISNPGLIDQRAASRRRKLRAASGDIETEAGPMASNRALSYGRACFGRGVKAKLVAANPFAGLEQVAAERSRDRVLDAEESAPCGVRDITASPVWRICPAAAADRPAAERGRRHALVGVVARPVKLDIAGRQNEEPRRAHRIAAWPGARDPADASAHQRRPVRALRRAQQAHLCLQLLQATARPCNSRRARGRGHRTRPEPPAWVLHDFRRSVVTWMASAGIPSDVADKILNHREGRAAGVKGVYQRYQYLPERARALEAWAAHVVAGEGHEAAANVVSLARAG